VNVPFTVSHMYIKLFYYSFDAQNVPNGNSRVCVVLKGLVVHPYTQLRIILYFCSSYGLLMGSYSEKINEDLRHNREINETWSSSSFKGKI